MNKVATFFAFLLVLSVLSSKAAAPNYLEKAKSFRHSHADSAFKYAKLSLDLARQKDDLKGIGLSEWYLGDVFAKYGVYGTAINHYLRAVEVFEQDQQPEYEATVRNQLGQVYYLNLSREFVPPQHRKALSLFRSIGSKSGEAASYGHLGHHYEKQEQLDSALHYQQLALAIYNEVRDSVGVASIYENLGSIYEDLEQYEEAAYYFNAAFGIYSRSNYLTEQIGLLNNLGDIERKTGNPRAGLQFTEQALRLANELNDKVKANSALKDLAKTYVLIGDFEKAHAYLKRSHEMVEEMYSDRNAGQESGLKALFEVNQKENEIALLKKDKHVDLVYRWILIIGSLLLVLLGMVLLRVQLQRRKRDKELYETNHQLIQSRLEQAQIGEQKLAIELENKALKEQQLEGELALKNQSLSTYALHIVQKNNVLKDIQTSLKRIADRKHQDTSKQVRHLVQEIEQNFKQDKDWEDFKMYFEKVHPHFYQKLKEKVPDLSPAELRLSTLLKLNLSTKDIAAILKVAPDSIRIARYRLRKKLPIKEEQSLVHFMMELE